MFLVSIICMFVVDIYIFVFHKDHKTFSQKEDQECFIKEIYNLHRSRQLGYTSLSLRTQMNQLEEIMRESSSRPSLSPE